MSVEYSGAAAYVNAKAAGLFRKAFVGERARTLFSAKSLPELWTLVFASPAPLVPGALLVQKIEEEAEARFIKQYVSLVEMYDKPHKILLDLLYYYDVTNLKEIGAALCVGKKEMPALARLGKYGALNYKAWPDIAAMTKDTPFAWYDKAPAVHERHLFDARLDNQYVKMMWQAAHETPKEVRDAAVDFFTRRYTMLNVIWALRLKVYYDMKGEEILSHLACIDAPERRDVIAGQAVAIIDKDVNNYADWADWKYAALLNPNVEGELWKLDPRVVEDAYRAELFRRAELLFHKFPLTDMTLIAWFMIKRHECDIIRTAAESIRLGIDAAEAANMAGLSVAG